MCFQIRSSTIFSACFSLVISFISAEYFQSSEFINALLTFGVFIAAYIVVFFIFRLIANYLDKLYYNLRRHGTKMDVYQIKEIIDDFDHIACDNNLIVKEYIEKYPSGQDKSVQTFLFFEILYYSKVSAEKTLSVINYPDSCINTMTKRSGIDLFRIYNQLTMLESAQVRHRRRLPTERPPLGGQILPTRRPRQANFTKCLCQNPGGVRRKAGEDDRRSKKRD